MKASWTLDPNVAYLNHGSFGACPAAVLAVQSELRARLEREPVRFLVRELEPLVDDARATLAAFVGADVDDLVFVENATDAVNAVLRSLRFEPGDQLLTTDHAYNACKNVLDWVAARSGAEVVVARVPFPLASPDEVTAAIVAATGPRTRLALIDHVTSPTALVFPIAAICAALHARGIDVLVDGAHAPGMLPLDVRSLQAAYYTGNCHKWLCAPKGVGFLVVRKDRQEGLVPTVISHGLNAPAGRSRLHQLFDWVGSRDPTAALCVPAAIAHVGGLLPGGWPEVMAKNHALALAGRRVLLAALGQAAPCPDEMIGSIASVLLSDGPAESTTVRLFEEHGIEVPAFPWPRPPRRLLRISAQLYNDLGEYERLARVLTP